MRIKDIEPVGVIVQDGNDHGLIESEVIQGISTLPVGTKIYTAEQMQEYAKSKVREALVGFRITKGRSTGKFDLATVYLESRIDQLFKEEKDES